MSNTTAPTTTTPAPTRALSERGAKTAALTVRGDVSQLTPTTAVGKQPATTTAVGKQSAKTAALTVRGDASQLPTAGTQTAQKYKATFVDKAKHAVWSGGTKRKIATLGVAGAAIASGAYMLGKRNS